MQDSFIEEKRKLSLVDVPTDYFTKDRFMTDYSTLYSPQEIEVSLLNIVGRLDRDKFLSNCFKHSPKNWDEEINNQDIWELQYKSDDEEEDNDSSADEDEQRQAQIDSNDVAQQIINECTKDGDVPQPLEAAKKTTELKKQYEYISDLMNKYMRHSE